MLLALAISAGNLRLNYLLKGLGGSLLQIWTCRIPVAGGLGKPVAGCVSEIISKLGFDSTIEVPQGIVLSCEEVSTDLLAKTAVKEGIGFISFSPLCRRQLSTAESNGSSQRLTFPERRSTPS